MCSADTGIGKRFSLHSVCYTADADPPYENRPHALRLRIHYTFLERVCRAISTRIIPYLPTVFEIWLSTMWPKLTMLPDQVFYKKLDLEEGDDISKSVEAAAYAKLKSLQGSVIPRIYGIARCSTGPAIIMSIAPGHELRYVHPDQCPKVKTAIAAAYNRFTEAGIVHGDPQLHNLFWKSSACGDVLTVFDWELAQLNERPDDVKNLNRAEVTALTYLLDCVRLPELTTSSRR